MSSFNVKSIQSFKYTNWWIWDDTNNIFITSRTIPLKVTDTKEVLFADISVPGLNYTPLQPNRNGASKISFQLPIVNRLTAAGNSLQLSQFENLRNQDTPSILRLLQPTSQFRANPSVIYNWGTHRTPLRYWVTRCNFENDTRLTSRIGLAAFTMVDMELTLDENSDLYKAYVIARKVGSIAGFVQGTQQTFAKKGNRPY